MSVDVVQRAPAPANRVSWDWRSLSSRTWWPAARRTALALFFLAVLAVIVMQAREIEWSEVATSLRAYPVRTLLLAAAFGGLSYLLYSLYDLIARWHLQHRAPTLPIMRLGFIVYAFNLSLGAWIGAIALRYRLYARLGIGVEVTTRILGFSLLGNWLGYCLLAGALFLLHPLALPPAWSLDSTGLRLIGALLLALVAAYAGACMFAPQRSWHIKGHAFELPAAKVALVQIAVATCNWMLASAVVWVLLQGKVDYASTLSVMLLASMAGIIARVPAGLGVLEGVFMALLSHRVPQGELLAALLAYRALYQLAPLALAAALLLYVDTRAKPG